MITNNTSNKLKASKGSRDLEDNSEFEVDFKCKVPDRGDCEKTKIINPNTDKNQRVPLPTIVICQRDKFDNRIKTRPRIRDEFRMARGGTTDRRSTVYRGRGSSISRKVERENDTAYSSRKFQESLSKTASSDSAFSSKYYNESGSSKARMDFGHLIPEDSRISKQLRRLSREDDKDKFLNLCKQLQESLVLPENGRYIRRSLDLINESLLDMMHSAPGAESKFQAARCLGHVGYVLDQDFKRFLDWVFHTYQNERNEDVKLLIMKAVLETLKLDVDSLKFKDFAPSLMSQLQNCLEYADTPEFLVSTVDVILELIDLYPSVFTKHFRDTVDILVGWHIDSAQKPHIISYASQSLQRLARYWVADLQFSTTLLTQFLEDMESYSEEMVLPNSGRSSPADGEQPVTPEQCVAKITSLLKVFNTVMKCLDQHLNPTFSPTMTWSFLINCFSKMLHTIVNVLQIFTNQDLIVSANESTCLLLSYLQTKTSSGNDALYNFIDRQLSLVSEFETVTIISMLQMITKVIREVSANLPVELVHKLLGPLSALMDLRFSPSVLVLKEVVAVYHSLLNLKNIPLLQETYRYVLGDLENAYKIIVPTVKELCQSNPQTSMEYKFKDAQMVVMFHLTSLSDLANASNSIIGMWALKPSILELLAVKLEPYSLDLMLHSPDLQYSLLFLLYSHCSRYNHFVSSSGLVAHGKASVCDILGLPVVLGPDVTSSSPTSGHLTIILDLLSKMLSQRMTEEVVLLVLLWTRELLIQAQPYLVVLNKTAEFTDFLQALIKVGFTHNMAVALSVIENIEQFLQSRQVLWKPKLISTVADLCLLHLNSTDQKMANKVFQLLYLIPWHIIVKKDNLNFKKKHGCQESGFTLSTIIKAQSHHLCRGAYGEMSSQQFRTIMRYLLQGVDHGSTKWLKDMFCTCWSLNPSKTPEENKSVMQFRHMCLASNLVLFMWPVWEAARFCIISKLRTPLGKPQETFTSIEGAIKSLAREISSDDGTAEKWIVGVKEQQRARLLVEFVEFLEKATYNASEGCATAMVPPPKPVRTFFHTNKTTCAEWLTRIRMAVVVVALHAGHATTAIRHGHRLLQDLLDSGNIQGSDFERAVMYVCWALCKLEEPEAILGLYYWSKEVTGRKFYWLKAASDQASKRYEDAASSYCKSLKLECLTPRESPTFGPDYMDENNYNSTVKHILKPDSEQHVLGFMADQVSECYIAVNNWDELLQWKEKENTIWCSQNGGPSSKHLMNRLTRQQVHALHKFEKGEKTGLSVLEEWPTVWASNMATQQCRSWSSYRLLGEAENVLMGLSICLAEQDKDNMMCGINWASELNTLSKVIQWHLQEGVRHSPSEFMRQSVLLHYATCGVQSAVSGQLGTNTFMTVNEELNLDSLSSSEMCKVLWWGQCLEMLGAETSQQSFGKLCLNAARLARKEGNFKFAQRLLSRYIEREFLIVNDNLGEATTQLINKNDFWDVNVALVCMETAKLFYSCDQREKALNLGLATVLEQSSSLLKLQRAELTERTARSFVTLAKWLQEGSQLPSDGKEALLKLLSKDIGGTLIDIQNIGLIQQNGVHVIPTSEIIVGQLLHLGVSTCPKLAKAWVQFAAWCYRWGRRVVDATSQAGGGQLSESDRLAVQQILPAGIAINDLDRVYYILGQTRALADEEDIEADDYNTSEMIESQLQSVNILRGATSESLSCLVDIWRKAQKRVYIFYDLSAMAYFKYLELCGNKEDADCSTITATLRLLRLIVKHALELQVVLEAGLASTPTRPWKGIIPQLFSRLNHPETYVRRRLSELLCRVAEDAPHLITFPAVVGAADGGARLRDMSMGTSTSRLFGTCLSQTIDSEKPEEEEEEEEDDDDEDDESGSGEENQVSVLKNCFLAMEDTLSKQAPEAIAQVRLLVQELRRITLLWDELWLGTLTQHHTEISRRLSQLELEILRVDSNPSLTPTERENLVAEKHRIILKPLVFILEQLQAITSVEPETPHEKWFQEKFGKFIADAVHCLEHPPNARRPQESWAPMKQLQSRLQQRVQKRSAYSLRMSDVSPALVEMSNTLIAMPGVTPHAGTIITISSIDNNIAILPTKTKPKKLNFHGSDGQMYTYLFKGLEDLHLDERIMQFLSICNTMMKCEKEPGKYYARHYSVIPLGPRSGLISWVDGVTPLFGLYKRWQQREAASISLKTQTSSNMPTASVPNQVMRPSELFYKKLTPLLKDKGITNLDNRKEWPPTILQQVLSELIEETPKDLLAKELWCNSMNASGWWKTTRTYSYSVAVMSIIGYIIGLGDRHLDNVLVDLSNGEVVHIDYNVCFEKGKTLRVPENVPFRMTSNIHAALGVTGVEGIFRLACEHVLKIMKKGRETLLTLLEAFVYDPLIDWTPGNEAGYTGAVYGGGQAIAMETKQSRKELEKEVTYAMFSVRVAEMQADWSRNRDDLEGALPELDCKLKHWLDIQTSLRTSREALQDTHQLMALVKEAEAQPTHPLYSLAARHSALSCVREAVSSAMTSLHEQLEECKKHLSMHKLALVSVRGPQLAQWVSELNIHSERDMHLVFDLVKEFLQNAGQSQMIVQCEQSESELGSLAEQQTLLIRTCLDLLSQYGTVTSLYPISFINSHRTACYYRWLTSLAENLSLERCNEVAEQFRTVCASEISVGDNTHAISHAFHLQGALQEANIRLQKAYERMTSEGLPDPRLEATYTEARSAIASFLCAEVGAAPALECVCVTALCALNKRYLMMEAAAASAGDCLVDLMSREGDWFLDEMYLVSSLVTELTSLLPGQLDTNVQLVLQCLRSANNIFKGLQELNFNFHTIILPEALKTIQTEEPTVLSMVSELDDIVTSIRCPLPELLTQLEIHLRYIIMEMESPHNESQDVVAKLRSKYESLLLRSPEALSAASEVGEDSLVPGQMLLMGFNGLFEKLQLEGNALIAALDTLDTPLSWKKVDQVREAKAMSAPVFKPQARAVLEDIFLVKRLQTMQEFFSLCASQLVSNGLLHDDDRLNKPVRRFTADYVGRQLLGVTSQTLALALCLLLQRIGLNVSGEVEQRDIGAESIVSLDELCRKAVELRLKRGLLGTSALAQASGLTSSLESAWRRCEVARHLQRDVEARRSTLQRLQLLATAHAWLHEEALTLSTNNPTPLSRSAFMIELRNASSALLSLQPRLAEARDQQNSLVLSVEQRLKWAAGANPALTEVLAAFEASVDRSTDCLTTEQRLAAVVGNTCSALLHHEALRTRTPEATNQDALFLQLLEQCEKSCIIAASCDQNVTPAEDSLMQLLPPSGPVDSTWIHNIETKISDNAKTLQDEIANLQEILAAAQEEIKKELQVIRDLQTTHQRLMQDIRALLKSMSKFDDCHLVGLTDFLSAYRSFSERFITFVKEISKEELTVDKVSEAEAEVAILKETVVKVYGQLLELAKQQQNNDSKLRRPPLLRQESVCLSPRKGVPPTASTHKRDPHTGKAIQERNTYALGVWRRVRMKLEGRDPDPNKKASVQEQVDYVIHEAMCLKNLALLYEGWTPWV